MKSLVTLFVFVLVGCGSGTSAPSTPGTVADTTTFSVSAPNAPTSYTIGSLENPTLTLKRGISYQFNLNVSGHPFYIKSVQGNGIGNAYTTGVTGNGNDTGVLTFAVQPGAPSTLFYDCSIHSGMTGTITIIDQ